MSDAPADPPPLDDAELARRAGLGDREAFHMLYERYERLLWAYLVKRVGPSDADDLAQAAWCRIYVHLGGFRGEHFRAWAYEIARHLAVDHARRQASAPVRLEGDFDRADESTEEPIEAMLRPERQADFRHCLERLKGQEREVFLARVDDVDSPEVANRLSLPIDRVYKLYASARSKLKACLERSGR